jgi:hypothetical protein
VSADQLLAERRKKLAAALRALRKQQREMQQDLDDKQRLCNELKALNAKYWPEKPRGRGRKWISADGYDLVLFVEAARRADSTIEDALKYWFKIKSCDQKKLDALQVRYQDAKRHWLPAIERLHEIEVELAALDAKAKARRSAMTTEEVRRLVRTGSVARSD